MSRSDEASAVVYTVGHSTRTLEEFVALLHTHGVQEIVDVRRYPASRRHPHFSSQTLALELQKNNVAYRHVVEMGGRRTPKKGSLHTAWRSPSFRAYADHMESDEFQSALETLIAKASTTRQAIMCAEAVPWRCHRQLISDALVARGVEVRHIISDAKPERHTLSEHARVTPEGHVTYPEAGVAQMGLELE